MTHAPCALICSCGANHIAAIHNDLSGHARVKVLYQSAASAGWYRTDDGWCCGLCYGSKVLDAVLQKRAGVKHAMRDLDDAADRRAEYLRMEVVA